MEDDSESEEDDIQLSRSIARERLAAIASGSRRHASDQASQSRPPAPAPPPKAAVTAREVPREPPQRQSAFITAVTAPIPLGYPYNLPAPAPPMTPRTTRRRMLSTELSESLRLNLLWERQVSKVNMLGGARRGGLLGSRLQPMTAVNGQQQDADDRERQRRAAIARNRSMDDEYHTAGW